MRWSSAIRSVVAACLAAALFVSPAYALDVPAAPTLETPIVDQTGTLSPSQIQQLASQIAQSRKEKSYQIGILMIPTLGNSEYLEGYSIKVARAWGVGDKDTSNGAFILVVKDDHKMRIEVGRGLEGDLTDLRAGRIVRDVMKPAFQKNDFYGGLSGAVNSIQLAVSQQADSALSTDTDSSSSDGWDIFMTFLIIGAMLISWLGATLGRSKSWWAGGLVGGSLGLIVMVIFAWAFWTFIVTFFAVGFGLLLDFLVSRNYKSHQAHGANPAWWAGGGWFGGGGFGGGGGGGSFGGGGFSGGGSSGSW
ncbi:MAG: TPM domain-containing protein [Candidatus Saccharimonas sp.]